MNENENTKYLQTVFVDEKNRILGISSKEFGVDIITEFNCSDALTTEGIAKYKYVDGEVVERTQEEMDADYVAPVPMPTDKERLEALEAVLLEMMGV